MQNYLIENQKTEKLNICEICKQDLGLVHMNTRYCKPCKEELKRKKLEANRVKTPTFENTCKRCGKVTKSGRKAKDYYCGYCSDLLSQQEISRRKEKVKTDCGFCKNMYAHLCVKVHTGGQKFYKGSVVEDGVLISCPRFEHDWRK